MGDIFHEDWLTILSSVGETNHRLWFVLKVKEHNCIIMEGYEGKGRYHRRMTIELHNCRLNLFPKRNVRSSFRKISSTNTVNHEAQWIFSLESRRFWRPTQKYMFLSMDRVSMASWLQHLEPLTNPDHSPEQYNPPTSTYDDIYHRLLNLTNLTVEENVIPTTDNNGYVNLEDCCSPSLDYPIMQSAISSPNKKKHKKQSFKVETVNYLTIDAEKTQAINSTITERKYEFHRANIRKKS